MSSKWRRRFRRAAFSLMTFAGILVFLAIVLPLVTRSIRDGHESHALKAITTVQAAQVVYYSLYRRFAPSMQALGPPDHGASGPLAADLIDCDLAKGEKEGYTFALSPSSGGYTISVAPVRFPTGGVRSYFSDQTMKVHIHVGEEPATLADPVYRQPGI